MEAAGDDAVAPTATATGKQDFKRSNTHSLIDGLKETVLDDHTTIFKKHKKIFFCARIGRELLPAILVSLALVSYNFGLWQDRRGSSYHWYTFVPRRSAQLDRSAWHFAITKGESNPNCTADDFAALPAAKGPHAYDQIVEPTTEKSFNDWCAHAARTAPHTRTHTCTHIHAHTCHAATMVRPPHRTRATGR